MPDSPSPNPDSSPRLTPSDFRAGDEIEVCDPTHRYFGSTGVVHRYHLASATVVTVALTQGPDGFPMRSVCGLYARRLRHLAPGLRAERLREINLKRRAIECPKVNLP